MHALACTPRLTRPTERVLAGPPRSHLPTGPVDGQAVLAHRASFFTDYPCSLTKPPAGLVHVLAVPARLAHAPCAFLSISCALSLLLVRALYPHPEKGLL